MLASGTPSASGASSLPEKVTESTVSSAEGPAFGLTRMLTRSYSEKSTRGSAASTMSFTSWRYPGSNGEPRSIPYSVNAIGIRSQSLTGASGR